MTEDHEACAAFIPATCWGKPVKLYCKLQAGHPGHHVYPSGPLDFNDPDLELLEKE